MNASEPLTTLTLWEPEPGVLYTLEHVAHFSGVPRRHIVLYARHGLVAPAVDPRDAGWYFSGETIRTLRRLEALRALHHFDWPGLRLVLDLLGEIERLRTALGRAG